MSRSYLNDPPSPISFSYNLFVPSLLVHPCLLDSLSSKTSLKVLPACVSFVLREYVVKILLKVVPNMSFSRAYAVMDMAHQTGKGLVITTEMVTAF